jgi:hypothetical protein
VRGCAGRWEAAADGGGGAPGSGEKAALGFRPRTNASTRLFLKFLGATTPTSRFPKTPSWNGAHSWTVVQRRNLISCVIPSWPIALLRNNSSYSSKDAIIQENSSKAIKQMQDI